MDTASIGSTVGKKASKCANFQPVRFVHVLLFILQMPFIRTSCTKAKIDAYAQGTAFCLPNVLQILCFPHLSHWTPGQVRCVRTPSLLEGHENWVETCQNLEIESAEHQCHWPTWQPLVNKYRIETHTHTQKTKYTADKSWSPNRTPRPSVTL